MTSRAAKGPGPASADGATLKRTSAGRYETGDGRFAVERSSGGWMVVDSAQADELGLPLVRGPFATLDGAREAMGAARRDPAPVSSLSGRIAALPRRGPAVTAPRPRPEPPPIVIREYRAGDGAQLRALWQAVGFRSLGDDDASLQAFAQRNPGTLLVATRGGSIVGTAMGGWDGRRGWIYHVATALGERRSGLATRLVRQVEGHLQSLGCRKVNVIVRDDNQDGVAFWAALGYEAAPARQMGRELPG